MTTRYAHAGVTAPTKAVIIRRPTGTWLATFPCGCVVHGHDFTATYATVELSCPFHGVEALWAAHIADKHPGGTHD